MKNKDKLSKKQRLFVQEYLKDYNGTRAYLEVYKCSEEAARRSASRLLTNVDVKEAVEEEAEKRLKELGIDTYYILKGIKDVTEKCMEKEPVQYFDKEDGCWKDLTEKIELPNGETVDATVVKFNSVGALKGLELLGKYKSLFKDNVSVDVSTSKKLKDVFDQIGGKGLDE